MAETGVQRSLIVGGRDYEQEGEEGRSQDGGNASGALAAVAYVFALIPNFLWGFVFGGAFLVGFFMGVDIRATTAVAGFGVVWMLTMTVHHTKRINAGVRTSPIRAYYSGKDAISSYLPSGLPRV